MICCIIRKSTRSFAQHRTFARSPRLSRKMILFFNGPRWSLRGVVAESYWETQHRVVAGVLASKSIIMPFYSLLHILRGWHMSFVFICTLCWWERIARCGRLCHVWSNSRQRYISTCFMVYSNVSRSNRLWCPYPFDSSNDMVLFDVVW